jgi:hypothetical protein
MRHAAAIVVLVLASSARADGVIGQGGGDASTVEESRACPV